MTITQVQRALSSFSTSNTLVITLNSRPSRYNVLIATISSYNANGLNSSVSTITQQGVGWGLEKQSTNGYYDVEIWMGIVNTISLDTSKQVTITLNNQPTGGLRGEVFEYSGLSSQMDGTPQKNNGYGNITDTGSISTNNANDLIVGAVFLNGLLANQLGVSPTSSFLLQFQQLNRRPLPANSLE